MKSNIKENAHRKPHDYKVGDFVLLINKERMRGKLQPYTLPEGPWCILTVHTNGTVTILRDKCHERINMRCIRPYFS